MVSWVLRPFLCFPLHYLMVVPRQRLSSSRLWRPWLKYCLSVNFCERLAVLESLVCHLLHARTWQSFLNGKSHHPHWQVCRSNTWTSCWMSAFWPSRGVLRHLFQSRHHHIPCMCTNKDFTLKPRWHCLKCSWQWFPVSPCPKTASGTDWTERRRQVYPLSHENLRFDFCSDWVNCSNCSFLETPLGLVYGPFRLSSVFHLKRHHHRRRSLLVP